MTDLALRSVSAAWRGVKADKVWLLILLIPALVAILDPAQLESILTIAATAFLGTLPFIAIAVFLVAFLKATGAEALVARAFEGREARMVLFAALIGGLAPFCSCEVIPFIAGLLALGAPLAAVMAFWLSSPLIDPPQVFIVYGALGIEFAVAKIVSAVFIGLIGGYSMMLLTRAGAFDNPLKEYKPSGCCGGVDPFSGKPVWRFWTDPARVDTFRVEGGANGIFLIKWLTFAYLLEALLITYVPAEAVAGVVGGEGLLPIIIGAAVGAPAYLNGYAAPALVAGLMEQGMSPGAALSFMVAGAVSSIPAMAAVWSLVKAPVFGAYVALGFVGAVVSGVVFMIVI